MGKVYQLIETVFQWTAEDSKLVWNVVTLQERHECTGTAVSCPKILARISIVLN